MELNAKRDGSWPARSVRPARWPPRHALRLVGAALRPSFVPRGGLRNSPTVASASPPRSSSGHGAKRIVDRLVSLADPDARPIRKGKLGKPNEFGYVAQLAEVTANTGRGARGYLLPAASAPATRARTACCPRPPPSWTGSAFNHARSPSTAASRPGRPPRPWLGSRPPGSSSPVGPSRAPAAPAGAWLATAPAARAASATSNAATTCGAAACEVTRASGSGPAGRSWPTTSTPSPSRPPDPVYHRTTPPPAAAHSQPTASRPPVSPGQVIRRLGESQSVTNHHRSPRWSSRCRDNIRNGEPSPGRMAECLGAELAPGVVGHTRWRARGRRLFGTGER